MASNAPTEERPRRGLLVTAVVVGVLAATTGVLAVTGGLRAASDGPAKVGPRHVIDQGLFKVEPIDAQITRLRQFGTLGKRSLVVTMHVTNLGDKSQSISNFLYGVVAEPKPGNYVNASSLDSTGLISGAKTQNIHPGLPIDVQVVWSLPDNAAPQTVTVVFRKWSYDQSFATDVFEWSVYKGSPVVAKATLPVRAGEGS